MTILLKGVQESVQGGATALGGTGVSAASLALNASGRVRNLSLAAQTPAATVATYLAGSSLQVPNEGLKVGALLRWVINLTKTAAGVATSNVSVVAGINGTVADAAVLTFVKPAGTAAADEGTIVIEARVVSVSLTGVVIGKFIMTHNGNAAGHMAQPVADILVTSGAFDDSQTVTSPLIFGIVITTGAADAITVTAVDAEAKYV